MNTIKLIKDNGLIEGEPIKAPLLSDSMLKIRAQQEINEKAYASTTVEVVIPWRNDIFLGNLVEYDTGRVGKVTGISINFNRDSVDLMTLTIDQPT